MGRPQRKGESGIATTYISRKQALKKLQLSLKDFRRLCILKGIYPVEPSHKKKANKNNSTNKTYYLLKDIRFLAHEPLIDTLRNFKVFYRKLKKAIGKKDHETFRYVKQNEPVVKLDHLVKERYPTFIHALRELDDVLSICFLFSTVPKNKIVKSELVHLCRRLTVEFLHYCMETRCLRKVFISVKGFYYQVEVMGQTITWMTPHALGFSRPSDVDFKIMLTFVQFYTTVLGFVNYRLYNSINLIYPPKLAITDVPNKELLEGEEDTTEFIASLNLKLKSSAETSVEEEEILDEFAEDGEIQNVTASKLHKFEFKSTKLNSLSKIETGFSGDKLLKSLIESKSVVESDVLSLKQDVRDFICAMVNKIIEKSPIKCSVTDEELKIAEMSREQLKKFKNLFSNCKFYLNREIPRESLVFVIRCFGGEVSYDKTLYVGATFDESDETITHQIVDRPDVNMKYLSRSYVQPQWVYDCVNARVLLPVDKYLPGEKLPAHLSPFVEEKDGDYVPPEKLALLEYQKGNTEALKRSNEIDSEEDSGDNFEAEASEESSEDESVYSDSEDDDLDNKVSNIPKTKRKLENDESESRKIVKRDELKNKQKRSDEVTLNPPKMSVTPGKVVKDDAAKIAQREAAEEKRLAIMMMHKKDKHLYDKIVYSQKRKKREALKMKEKRETMDKPKKLKKK